MAGRPGSQCSTPCRTRDSPEPRSAPARRARPDRPRVAALMPFFSATWPFAPSPAGSPRRRRSSSLRRAEPVTRKIGCSIRSSPRAHVRWLGPVQHGHRRGPAGSKLARIGVPVVCVDYPLPGVPSVTVDNTAARLLLRPHLLGRAARVGHDLVWYLPPRSRSANARTRFLALWGPTRRSSVPKFSPSMRAARDVPNSLTHHRRSTASFVSNLSPSGRSRLKSRGRDVPGSVQVIGFDDQPLSRCHRALPMRQPIDQHRGMGDGRDPRPLARPSDRGTPGGRATPSRSSAVRPPARWRRSSIAAVEEAT